VRWEKGKGRESVCAGFLAKQVRGTESLNTRVFSLTLLLFFFREIFEFF